jgi:hypothetical protein
MISGAYSATRNLVYGLVDPRTDEVRYIGKSEHGISRPRSHSRANALRIDGNSHKANWIRELQREGLEYRIVVLDMLPDGDATGLYELEHYWISRGRASGWPLTNLNDGGPGQSGHRKSEKTLAKLRDSMNSSLAVKEAQLNRRGKKQGPYPPRTAEHRERLRQSHLGKTLSPESRAKVGVASRGNKYCLGKRQSPETRAKRSESLRRVWLDPEYRERHRLSMLGHTVSEETRAKLSDARRGFVPSDATRALWSTQRSGKKHSDATRAKMSASHKQRMQRQEHAQ